MNAFYEHHKNSIEFGYRCFDRLLLNGLIQPFQQPERVLGFLNAYREGRRVTHRALTEIADQFLYWTKNRSEKWGAPIVEAPEEQRRVAGMMGRAGSSPAPSGTKPNPSEKKTTGRVTPKPATAPAASGASR